MAAWAENYKSPAVIGLDKKISESFGGSRMVSWWRITDSNRGHKDYDSSALTD